MKLEIIQDDDYFSPREDCDNFGEMLCFHRRYNLGDKHDYNSDDYEDWMDFEKALRAEDDPAEVVLPLNLYDHSGLTMSVAGFHCRWDSGQVGLIIARRSKILEEFNRKRISESLLLKVKEILQQEVKTYDQYLRGDIWGYQVIDKDGDIINSCWGFYGREYCEEEGNAALKYEEEHALQVEMEAPQKPAVPACCVP